MWNFVQYFRQLRCKHENVEKIYEDPGTATLLCRDCFYVIRVKRY